MSWLAAGSMKTSVVEHYFVAVGNYALLKAFMTISNLSPTLKVEFTSQI